METPLKHKAWNKGKLIGQKPPLKPKDIWAIRFHLHNRHAIRDLAMFNLAIDSKLRGCDLVSLHVRDATHGNQILPRAMVIQRKTQHPVQFELTEPTRVAVAAWIEKAHLRSDQNLFPSRICSRISYIDAAICAIGPSMDRCGRTRFNGIRYSLDATYQSYADLQTDKKPEGSAITTGAYKTRKYGALPRY